MQRVDLVDEEDERRRVGRRPLRQRVAQRLVGAGLGEDAGPGFVQESVAQGRLRPRGEAAEHRPHRPLHVAAGRAGGLDGGVHAAAALPVQQVAEREQGGRLAGLAGGVQHEVLLHPDEKQHLVRVETREGRDAVMVRRAHRAGGVEEAHGSAPRRPSTAHRRPLPMGSSPSGASIARRRSPPRGSPAERPAGAPSSTSGGCGAEAVWPGGTLPLPGRPPLRSESSRDRAGIEPGLPAQAGSSA